MADSITPSKTCTKCHQAKLPALFVRDKRKKNGYGSTCLACEAIRSRAKYAAGREAHLLRCKDWAKRNPDKVRVIRQRWRATHAEAERERYRRARRADLEKHRAKVRLSYQKHAERRRAESREYYEANKERIAQVSKVYRRANPEKDREQSRRRRLRKKVQGVGKVDYRAVLLRDGYMCHICGQFVLPEHVSFDHIIPLSKDGLHAMDNLAIAHRICNQRKNAKIMESALPPPINRRR